METNWYYIDENGDKQGPFNYEELKKEPLNDTTMVWTDSMNDWEKAKNVATLKGFWTKNPPPTPKEKAKSERRTYKSENEGVKVDFEDKSKNKFFDGMWKALILTVGLPIYLLTTDASSTKELSNQSLIFSGLLTLATIWVYLDLKRYLNQMNNFSRANGLISFIIMLELAGFAIDYFYPGDTLNFETKSTSMVIILSAIPILYLITHIIFAIVLLTIKKDFSGWVKPFSITILVSLISLIILAFDENNVLAVCLFALPFLVLVILFGVTNYELSEDS